ncbi:hypothetical protein Q4Q35_03885 [Flavivirga aquimarina]|uniref:Cold-shock protein n=1 Tax=Flavivirga aquimarina TaxID=2027862 RepID=A0ABT8W737_9FLAO|nr:hypothetical protein [Flavivirga aquimarina]MDO5968938.1 hypothetical protein [Flavivirga aquimarina]
MSKSSKYQLYKSNKTSTICNDSGSYYCNEHDYIQNYIHEGDTFPKCDRGGRKHNTVWFKFNN